MLLLYPNPMVKPWRSEPIYIPLCFYFIGFALRDDGLNTIIYIPLCFYFINRSGSYKTEWYRIYIPLCFYFIHSNNVFQCFFNQFTFHYASTLSRSSQQQRYRKFYLHSTMLLLYRLSQSAPVGLTPYLHSTMLLLYLLRWFCHVLLYKHLHSTMLLLYPFTSSFASPFSFSYLHSTMLLLYHNLYGSIVLDEIIYIPLCFYFIQPC